MGRLGASAQVAPHLEELGEKGSSEDMADFVAGVAAAKDKAVLVADAYLRITMTGWLALVLLVRLALAKVGMGHRLLMVLDGPCSWMKRWWTDRSRVGTPGDPVRGTAATKARAEYRQNDIPFITSADEQDHESQRMGVLGLVAVLIDQDSDFFDFLMRLWLRGIQVEQVFKKLGDDGHMRWVRLNFESWYQELRTKVTSDPNLSDEERMDRVDLFLELLQMLCASDIGFPILGVGRDLICKWMLILVRERGSDLLRLTSARDPVQQEEALQIVVDFLGTSRILPGRAAVKAMSLEVAACAYVHSSGPAFWRAGVADMPCLLLPRLLSRQRLLAAHRQLYSAADMAATQLAFTQQLAERRLAVQQAVLDEARQGLTAAAATREAEGRPLQLPAAIPQLLPSASQMEWTDGRLPQPAHVVLAVLILACRVPMSEARRLLGSHLSSSAASTHHWIALGGKSMQQLVRHLQQFGGLQPEEAMAAREAAEFEDLMAGAGRLLQQAVEQRGAPPEVLDAHASLVPTPELIEVCADGRTRPSPAMWACVELHLMGINAEDAVALVEGAPAAAAVRQWATRSLAATLSQTLAAGDASEAVAALRAIAAVDGTAGTAHLSAQEAAFWRQHLMRLREQACRRLPPLVSRQRLSQAEAVMLVACIARVSLPPDDTLHAAKQAFKASTLLAATLLSLFPSRFTAPTALLAAGSNANNRGTALKPGDTLWPLVRQLKADFGAAREQAAAQAAEAAEEELAAAAAEAAEAEAAAEAAAGKQQKKCSECGATSTSVWRPHPDDPAKRVCHACRQKMDIASGRRPTDVEYKRRRQEKEAQQAQQQQQPSPQPQQAQQAQQQQVEQPQQAQQQQEAEQAPPPPPKRKAAKKQKPPPLDQQQQQHCDKVAAALLAAAGRAACAKAGVTSGPLGLSAAAAAGSPSPQQLAARQWYLVDVVGALCGVLAERVARRELSLEAAKSKARRAAELVPPEDWACPRGNFKVKPTAAACVLYAVDPSSIGIPAAMVAAGGSPNVKPTKHLEEGGTLSWVMPQLGTSINPTGVHVNRKRKQ